MYVALTHLAVLIDGPGRSSSLESLAGIEPALSAWQAEGLPLTHSDWDGMGRKGSDGLG